MANPVYRPPVEGATTVAVFPVGTLDMFHAEIDPFRLAKMKRAGPVAPM
jgi:hypothetical protein